MSLVAVRSSSSPANIPVHVVVPLSIVALALWGIGAGRLVEASAAQLSLLRASSVLIASCAAAAEAGFWCSVWAARGVRVRYVPLAFALLALSGIDAVGVLVQGLDPAGRAARLAVVALAGPVASGGADGGRDGFDVALGGAGLLTALRMTASAACQATLARRPFRDALLGVLAAWVLGRLVVMWLVDLARGASPLG